MNKVFLLLLLTLSNFANQSNDFFNTSKSQLEGIAEKDVTLNKVVPFYTNPKKLIALLSKPDSVVSEQIGCGSFFESEDIVSTYYYGKTCFEIYKREAIFKRVSFTDSRFKFYIKDKPLDGNTSLSEIAKLYPTSFKDSYDWQDDKSKKTYRLVWIDTIPVTDTKWIFRFYRGKLIEIEYRLPC